ncbi:hypothetical protein TNCV_284681 [Trichonephila clavipes]|uniref:Uncharacterized protein n=1 Tax=Trichonephila clavipes TaxID=2585209 RepID=A0A8X6VMS8_TRICX|nr:hypothetical protein TNCV_284681 [Trichonephila clavipes]
MSTMNTPFSRWGYVCKCQGKNVVGDVSTIERAEPKIKTFAASATATGKGGYHTKGLGSLHTKRFRLPAAGDRGKKICPAESRVSQNDDGLNRFRLVGMREANLALFEREITKPNPGRSDKCDGE